MFIKDIVTYQLSTFVSKWHKSAQKKRQNHIVCQLIRKKQYCINQLLKQGYVAAELKSSLQKLYGRHHGLVYRYEICISQMTMDLLLLTSFVFHSTITAKTLTEFDCIRCIRVTRRVSYQKQELITLHSRFGEVVLFIFLVFYVVLLSVSTFFVP